MRIVTDTAINQQKMKNKTNENHSVAPKCKDLGHFARWIITMCRPAPFIIRPIVWPFVIK